jgi:hypothetical protein
VMKLDLRDNKSMACYPRVGSRKTDPKHLKTAMKPTTVPNLCETCETRQTTGVYREHATRLTAGTSPLNGESEQRRRALFTVSASRVRLPSASAGADSGES